MDVKVKTLQALKAYLTNTKVEWTEVISEEEWSGFFAVADLQHILPMVFEAVYDCDSFKKSGSGLLPHLRQRIRQSVMLQTFKTREFLELYETLSEKGIKPITVKGIICRSLFPNPDYRESMDEDLFIEKEAFPRCHEIFTEHGMEPVEPEKDIFSEGEVAYKKKESLLYIELHKELFPAESEAYGNLNRFFEESFEHAICHEIEGMKVWSLGHTDHLLYLICHAFKHFIHSGFGIRQVCDIVMYAKTFGREVDWNYILECCREMRADQFAAALFRIGIKYLALDPNLCGISREWLELSVDPEGILDDLLSGSVFGAADDTRRHSSTITLNAVAADRRGETAKPNLWKSIFPPLKDMAGKYPYLKEKPFLLPVAWSSRILKYRKENAGKKGNAAQETIKIGSQRVELLRKYGIIK